MLGEVWKRLFGYLERQPYWSKLEPVLLAGLLYVAALVLTYQYVQWQYHYAPEPFVFLRSYLAKQVTAVYLAVALAVMALLVTPRATDTGAPSGWRIVRRRGFWLRVSSVSAAAVLAGLVWAATSPSRTADDITIVFHTESRLSSDLGFDTNALTYLIYELNRQQRAWHYEIDTELFDASAVTHAARASCEAHPVVLLCLAGAWAAESGAGQLILVSGESLGKLGAPHYFWSHEAGVSVISTADWRGFSEPSVYEYLAYSIIQQTIRIHLETQCRLLSQRLEREATMRAGIFEFVPNRAMMPPRLLSAQLSSPMEETLFNCFGAQYTVDAKRLLSLDWLRSEPVPNNLRRVYGVRLSGS
jgi:hypothetical protein